VTESAVALKADSERHVAEARRDSEDLQHFANAGIAKLAVRRTTSSAATSAEFTTDLKSRVITRSSTPDPLALQLPLLMPLQAADAGCLAGTSHYDIMSLADIMEFNRQLPEWHASASHSALTLLRLVRERHDEELGKLVTGIRSPVKL